MPWISKATDHDIRRPGSRRGSGPRRVGPSGGTPSLWLPCPSGTSIGQRARLGRDRIVGRADRRTAAWVPDTVRMKARVAVSPAGTHSGLAAIRHLGRAGHAVVGFDRTPAPFGLHSRWSLPTRILPDSDDAATLLDSLSAARADVLLPIESRLVGIVCAHRADFDRQMATCLPPHAAFRAAYDNKLTLQACHALGVAAPRLLEPGGVTGPFVVKPRQDIGGAAGVSLCSGADELESALATCRPFGEPVVQEYIPGGAAAMRTVLLLFDRQSRLVARFTTRKLRTFPVAGGLTTASVSTDDADLVRADSGHVSPPQRGR